MAEAISVRLEDKPTATIASRRAGLLIVGGGPAGCAAAITLGRAGLSAELIERKRGDHEVACGGFLGWDALAALSKLGLDAFALGARPIRTLRLVDGQRTFEARLPALAAGLSRRKLDAALLDAAAQAGTLVRQGVTAKAIDIPGRRIRFHDGEEVEAAALFLATGKYDLRGAARPRKAGKDPLGLRTAISPTPNLERALDEVIEIHLFDGGYAGLLLQEDGKINLCLSVAPRRLKQAGGIVPLIAQIAGEAPGLGNRIDGADPDDWLAVSGVPYGWQARRTEPGLYRLGDQAAVIASIVGDGIAIALESGIAAASAFASGQGALPFQRHFGRRARTPLAIAEALRWVAEQRPARAAGMRLLGLAPMLAPLAARLTRLRSA